MSNRKRLFTFPLLALGAACLISGCSSGGSSNSSSGSTAPAAAVSGVVADGYLYNAKVCSDQNLNNVCDDGEPFTFSDENGQYELTGDSLDQYPIVVEVTAGETVDQDNPSEPIAKDYVLSTPAGKPEFISPLTTMVHQQVESNPALSVEEAETVIKGQLGLASEDNVSLFVNYVEQEAGEEETAATYEQLHDVAQVVATTFAEMQEDVQAALDAAPDNDYTLDDVLEVVVEKVVSQLDEIVTLVEESGEEFDPETISLATMETIIQEGGLDAETIAAELEAAATEVVQSSFESALAGEGFYSFWAESYYDMGQEMLELERWKLSLDADGNLVEDAYEFNFETMDWESTVFDDDEWVLTANGWQLASDAPGNYDLTFNDDGSATLTHRDTGETETVVAVELDLSGKLMAPFLGGFDEMLVDPAAVFPEGSKGFEISSKLENDAYYVGIWNDDDGSDYDYNVVSTWDVDGPTPVATLGEVLTTFALENQNNQFLYLDYNVALQFNGDGQTASILVPVFSSDGTVQTTLLGTASYEEMQINGQAALLFSFPPALQEATDYDEGQMFLIQWDESTVKFGEYIAGGTFESDEEVGLNQVAYDAIVANISMAQASVGQVVPFTNDMLAGNTFYMYWDDSETQTLETEAITFEKQPDGTYVLSGVWSDVQNGVVVDSGQSTEAATLQADGSLRIDFDQMDDNGATYAIVTLLRRDVDGLVVYYADYSASGELMEEGSDKLFFEAQTSGATDPAVTGFTLEMFDGVTYYSYWEATEEGLGFQQALSLAEQTDGSLVLTNSVTEISLSTQSVVSQEVLNLDAELLTDGTLKVYFPAPDEYTNATYSIVTLLGQSESGLNVAFVEYDSAGNIVDQDQELWSTANPF